MADVKKETILLEIDTTFGDSIQQMSTLKSRIDNLKDATRDLEKENKELRNGMKEDVSLREKNEKLIALNNEEIQKNAVTIRNLTERQREYGKTVENEIKMRQNEEGSIKQMRLQLIELRKNYESLSKTEREGLGGQNMLKDIERQTAELKKLEAQQLDFRRNVGNYADALLNIDPAIAKLLKGFKDLSGGTMDVGVAFKNAVPLMKSFAVQLKALAVNPFVQAVITIVVVMKQLVDQFRQTDDAVTALQQLFASLSPIFEVFTGILDATVKVLTKVISGVTKGITAIMSLVPAFEEASKAAQDYVLALDELEEKERQYGVQTAKNNIEIARARNKAAQADVYSVEERRDATQKAIELEKQNLQMELDVAAEKLRLAQQDAARRRDTSDETKNNIAELEKAYYQAIANTESGMRRLYSQMAKFNSEIRKDTINTWKTIIGNSAFSTADWKKADENYKKMADNMDKRAKELAARAAEIAEAGLDSTKLDEAAKQAAKDAEDIRNEQKTEHKKYLDALKNLSEQYYSNELSARRAYEDAVIEMMDDGLDKQLELIDKEYEREIEDLKHKLKTEEHLTAEARKKINELIQLKQKQWNEQRIMTEAAYWSETREMARSTMNEISKIMQDTMTDPNNILGGFIIQLHNELAGITDEFENSSDMLLDYFSHQYEQLVHAVNKALDDADLAKTLTPNVREVLTAIAKQTDEFSNNATKSLDSFILALETMQERLKMTPEEIAQMRDAVKPIMENINRYYNAMAELPSRYMEKLYNAMYSKMSAEAKKVRDMVMKTFEFKVIDDEQVKNFQRDINVMDNVMKNAMSAWQYRITHDIGFKIDDPLKIKGIDWDKYQKEIDEKLDGMLGEKEKTIDLDLKLDWNIETDDTKLNEKMNSLAAKYGDIVDNSFSGILKQITGTDDAAEQLDWLLKNYNEAIQKVREMNDDMWFAYSTTGREAFYNAIPDTSTILQGLQQIYTTYIDFTKTEGEYDKERLEIQNKYLENGGNELQLANELEEVNKREYEQKKRVAEQQKEYLLSIRDEVSQLEAAYNKVNAENTQQIKTLETQLQILHDEAATIDSSTPEGEQKLEENRLKAEQIRSQIEQLRSEIEQSLAELVATGFTTTGELDVEVQNLVMKILEAQNQILQSTATQTTNWSKMWFNTFSGITSGLGQMAGAFKSLFDEMGEGNERMAAFAEAATYFQIGMSMAEGLAAAVAKGMEMGWPAAAVMIPVGISTVVAGIAEAVSTYRSYHAPKYAKGGYVSGEKGVDKIPAWLSDGEYVIKRKRVKELGIPFLDALNEGKSVFGRTHFAEGGVVTTQIANEQMSMENMREMMVAAVSEIQPIVSVKEISSVQNRVKVKESIAKK